MKKLMVISLLIFLNACSSETKSLNGSDTLQSDGNKALEVDLKNNDLTPSQDYVIAREYKKESNNKLYLEYLIKAANAGDPIAQDDLGGEYAFGEILEKNDEKFLYWTAKSASSGYLNAQINLGMAHYSGSNGLKKDNDEAKKWFTLAAAKGDEISIMYLNKIENE